MDVPILACIFFTFNWLALNSEMQFVKFHPEVASCLLSRGKRKYAPLGMRLLWKYINYFLVYHLISHILLYLQNYKEFKAEILDLQSEKYGLSFDIKIYTTSGWALEDENVIGIRAFNYSNSKFKSLLSKGGFWPVRQDSSCLRDTICNFNITNRHFAFLSDKILKLNGYPEYFGILYSWWNHQMRFRMVHFNIENAKSRVA